MSYITIDNKLVLIDGKPIITPNEPESQEKTIDVTANGTYTVEPDSGKTLNKVTANVNVPSSGPINPVSPSDITFYDYDGTVVEAWTLAELATKTALPDYPTHEGLTCQGWNWTLAELKEENRQTDVGAMYVTDDGKTRIYVHLTENGLTPMMAYRLNGTLTINWGDGTNPDTYTGTSLNTSTLYTSPHTYVSSGDYVIELTVDGVIEIMNNRSYNSGFFLKTEATPGANQYYSACVKKIEVGIGFKYIPSIRNLINLESISLPNSITGVYVDTISENNLLRFIVIPKSVTSGVSFKYMYSLIGIAKPKSITATFYSCYCLNKTYFKIDQTLVSSQGYYACQAITNANIPSSVTNIYDYAFFNCTALFSVNIPSGVTSIGSSAFSACLSLTSIDIPNGVTVINNSVFSACSSLRQINIPNGVTSIGNYAFNACSSLEQIDIPDGVTSIGNYAFSTCVKLSYIKIPSGVTNIGSGTFQACSILKRIDFVTHTSVPTLANTNAFSNLPSDFKILVPLTLVDEWKAATNWSTYADHIVGVAENNFVYTVDAVSGAIYGFTLNSDGYYESQNKGVNNSYALCRVNITNPLNKKVYFDCINYAESNYDFGILGNVNQALTMSNAVDSSYKKSFKGLSSANVQTVEYDDATGDCFIDVKFRKDSSGNSNNDSLQFKVRVEE